MERKAGSIPKIIRPGVSDALPRKRLYRLMDSHRKKPIIWIHGPAGSGKTTLIAHYLDDRQLLCLWYQLDKSDSEIANFFYYMGLAVKKTAPEKKPLPLLSPEYLLDIPLFARRYFEAVYSYLKTPLVMVFDNYQDVSEGSLLHEVIRQGLHGALVQFGANIKDFINIGK